MRNILPACAALLLIVAPVLHADVEIRISFKVILGPAPTNEFPDNTNGIGPTSINLNSEAAIRTNIAAANAILESQRQGCRLVLRDNTVYQLAARGSDWFTRDFRTSAARDALYDTANASTATKADWQWHDDSVNVYLNDSRSGVCSFVADNKPLILVGAGAYRELLLHELGHYFDLAHTHIADNDNMVPAGAWQNGDGLSETLDDDADATAAQINAKYPGRTQDERNDLIFNLMSYHQPQNRFVWQQREIFLKNANIARAPMVSGRAFFVAPDGSDGNSGLEWAQRRRTLGFVHGVAGGVNDVMVIQSGTYNANTEGLPATMDKPITISAWRGPVVITR
jgi:hypothetical protein